MTCSLPALPANTKCTRCRSQATIRMPSHHANFCAECFISYFRNSVLKAMKKFGITLEHPLLVAVSGGKDSLALWDVLSDLGFNTKGLHIDLGIQDFSEPSLEAVNQFAAKRNLSWSSHSLRSVFGHDIPEIRRRTRRKICSVCGMLKRQLMNRLTAGEGFDILVTGHNLDDEAGRLLGNIVRHREHYVNRQYPFLPPLNSRLPSRAKPLYRLDAREILIYCDLKGIAPLRTKCPLSRGATSHFFKEALQFLEDKMPTTKRDFLFTHLDRKGPPPVQPVFAVCRQCGEASYGELCAVCNLKNHLGKPVKEAT